MKVANLSCYLLDGVFGVSVEMEVGVVGVHSEINIASDLQYF